MKRNILFKFRVAHCYKIITIETMATSRLIAIARVLAILESSYDDIDCNDWSIILMSIDDSGY